MEDRCIACGEIIPEGQQVCRICERGDGSRMMKNGSGAAVPTEEAAMRNIEKENHRYVEEVFGCIEQTLSLLGYTLESIHIRDRKNRKQYKRDREHEKRERTKRPSAGMSERHRK